MREIPWDVLDEWHRAHKWGEGLDEIPPGWFTTQEYGEKYGVSEKQALHRLKTLLKEGKIEMRRCTVRGRARLIWHVCQTNSSSERSKKR